ncbi:decarboxylating 6-phosphogluconate dehydrogenase [Nitriliruptoraceae bacterium ZYF776]|nr:decarboxylating 6-phosphogluconate dehydrogenase [Profundirhabdus halotolerans]
MRIGMVGLGKMGANMAERLRRAGHEVVGYDTRPGIGDVDRLDELLAALDGQPRRVVWVMVPAGGPTDATITELAGLVAAGDLVVDGGNSDHRAAAGHARTLAVSGASFLDVGVSGGVWGLEAGYSLMVGGDAADVADLQPVLDALGPPDGVAHVGPVGAGHFTKMVHNGVEYALMQAYGEGYELLRTSDLDVDVAAALQVWRHGSVVRSWLLDLLADAVSDDPELSQVRGYAEDSGEGRWTVRDAIDQAVPVPTIAAALFARFASRQEESPAMQAVAVLRDRFGGHGVRS